MKATAGGMNPPFRRNNLVPQGQSLRLARHSAISIAGRPKAFDLDCRAAQFVNGTGSPVRALEMIH